MFTFGCRGNREISAKGLTVSGGQYVDLTLHFDTPGFYSPIPHNRCAELRAIVQVSELYLESIQYHAEPADSHLDSDSFTKPSRCHSSMELRMLVLHIALPDGACC